jgi:hypothetical protein
MGESIMANSTYVISATAQVNAPPRRVYDTIANYHTGHPRILPKQFQNLKVEHGGIGAGTVITFQVRMLGQTITFRAEVTEPDPGRVLVETNVKGSDSVTTFIVEPGDRPDSAMVTISTVFQRHPGVSGAIEKFVTERVIQPMYAEELRLLESVAASDEQGRA